MMAAHQLFLEFLQNGTLILGHLFLYTVLKSFLPQGWKNSKSVLLGLLLGASGAFLEDKGAILALSGALGGPWAAAIAALMTLAYSGLPGGSLMVASALILTLAPTGVFFFFFLKDRTGPDLLVCLLALAAATGAWTAVSFLLLPMADWSRAFDSDSLISLLFSAAAVFGIGLLFVDYERHAATRNTLRKTNLKLEQLLAKRTSALNVSQQSLRLILDSLSDAVFIYDLNGSIVDVNKKMLEIYEIPERERAIGTSPLDYSAPEAQAEPALDPRAQPALGKSVRFLWNCRTAATGRRFPAEVELTRIDYRGKAHWLAVVRDIQNQESSESERKRRQAHMEDVNQDRSARLSRLNERLQTAAKAAQMGIWDWDVTNNLVDWDETQNALYGVDRSRTSVTPQTWVDSLHPDDRESADAAVQAAIAGQKEFDTEFRIRKGGEIRHIRAFAQVIRDSEGKAVRMVGVNYDITDRKNIERALLSEKNLAQQYLDVVEAIVLATDERGQITLLNRKGYQVLGYEPGTLQGRDWFKICVPGDQYSSVHSIHQQILSGKITQYEFLEGEIVAKTGERRYVAWHNAQIKDEAGKVVGMLSSGEDITERRNAQSQLDLYSGHLEEVVNQRTKELELARDAANAANDAKSLFLANMSHEIRTPMNAVLGFAQLLAKESGLSGSGLHKVATIIKNGEHLLAIINDILEMSRIEAGRLELKSQAFDLGELLSDLSQQFGQRAAEKGLEWRFEKVAGLPRLIVADPVRLRQVLINLLGNAVKFTDKGSVGIRALPVGTGRIAIEVSDTGVGIPEDERERLFQPFERTRAGKEVAGGTGLGLAISRRYALLMGGDITIETPRSGTCFRLEFSAPAANSLPGRDNPLPNLPALEDSHRGTVVLVADDLRSNRELLRGMLEPQGFEVVDAADGAEAVRLVAVHQPRIVLMDLLMPGLDGYEATLKIRRAHPDKLITVIGISASAFAQERTHFESSGLDGFLAKPFRFQELHQLISELTGIIFAPVESSDKAISPVSDTPLPQEWSVSFSEALAQGNVTRLRQLADSAQAFDPGLSEWISERTSRYELDELRRFIKSRGVAP